MNIKELKETVKGEVDAQRAELTELSLRIHDNPELGLNEVKAAQWLTEYLEERGFQLERGICQLPTAFRAACGTKGPTVAFMAEYDALPKLGHACGHNIIATAALGAAVAMKAVLGKTGGTIVVMGTPAEEIIGGKSFMVKRGGFAGIDAALMVHPGVRDTAITSALALVGLDVEFFGRAAHAAARPEDGINALEALIMSFNAINSLRQHIKDRARIHGVITDGGEAANIVPAHAAGSFLVRAEDDDYLETLRERVLACFTGAATATGARLEYKWAEGRYAALRTNLTIAGLYGANMESLGRRIYAPRNDRGLGSTDMGNVSVIMPAIHPSLAIAPLGVSAHSPEFEKAAASEEAHRGMAIGAKALAMTAIDLLAIPENLARAKEEFLRRGEAEG
ncbi:MAG: M20 family metallopeptidase [Chloroflexi bacterium]|nr:M20 family metallopeptidase [Chloroflexota bacterium]